MSVHRKNAARYLEVKSPTHNQISPKFPWLEFTQSLIETFEANTFRSIVKFPPLQQQFWFFDINNRLDFGYDTPLLTKPKWKSLGCPLTVDQG